MLLTLGKIAEVIDCEHKTAPATADTPFGYSVGTRALTDNRINLSLCKPISEETYLAWSRRARLAKGDIIFAREAPVGGVGIVNGDVPLSLGQRTVLIRPDNSVVDSKYLFYLLRSANYQQRIAELSTGTTVLHINVADIRGLRIDGIPDFGTQQAIAAVLSGIEEKIEVNERIASLLEKIAQTIFKSWFVDFDPVHAKARGEQPVGMDAETAALFPDTFDDSKLGPIASGWRVDEFGSVCHLLMGQSPPGDSYNMEGDGLPFYQGRTDFGKRFPARRMFATQGNRKANPGDTLVSVRAPVGDTNQATEECVIGRGVASARHHSDSEVYTYSLLHHMQPQLAYYNGEGTVFGAINRRDFESILVVEPARAIVDAFERLLGPTNLQIRNLFEQVSCLTELRDSLLPRLISGELEIPAELLGA